MLKSFDINQQHLVSFLSFLLSLKELGPVPTGLSGSHNASLVHKIHHYVWNGCQAASTSTNTPSRQLLWGVRNKFMTCWDWNEWISTHGSCLGGSFYSRPTFPDWGHAWERATSVTVFRIPLLSPWSGWLKRLLLCTPLPYVALLVTGKMIKRELTHFTVTNTQMWSSQEAVRGHLSLQLPHSWLWWRLS